MSMKILFVGAGAVGKIYARHLAMGGADITFLVKEKYEESLKTGFYVYLLNDSRHRHTPLLMSGYEVLTSYEAVGKQQWDYVILCMSSPALKGPWLDELIPMLGQATLVSLQPGLLDRDFILQKFPANRLIEGTIPIVSYQTPLPQEQRLPGVAYWLPPGASAALSGPAPLLEPLLACFKRGNFKAHAVKDARKENRVANPVLNLFILALEHCDWSFAKLRHDRALAAACAAMPEAIEVNAKKTASSIPAVLWFLRPTFFRVLMTVSRYLVPFDFETYLKVHFTKVREQMHEGLTNYLQFGNQCGCKTTQLQEFLSLIARSAPLSPKT